MRRDAHVRFGKRSGKTHRWRHRQGGPDRLHWKLLRTGLAARYLLELAKGVRKFGAGLTVVSQDADDVLSTDIGRAVVSNAATQLLLRQAPQAIDKVTDAFNLTDGERQFLLSAGRGDALLACGTARVAFHSIASDLEAEHIQTGPAAARAH